MGRASRRSGGLARVAKKSGAAILRVNELHGRVVLSAPGSPAALALHGGLCQVSVAFAERRLGYAGSNVRWSWPTKL